MVEWLTVLVRDQDVLGSTPTTFKLFSSEPAILKIVQCQPTKYKNKENNIALTTTYATFKRNKK